MIFCYLKSICYMYMWFWITSMSVISVITTLTSMCCRTSLYISTAILWTRWLQLLYMMALVNMSIISRWNSAVDRIAPLSMFFLIWLRSIRLRERNHQLITDQSVEPHYQCLIDSKTSGLEFLSVQVHVFK